MDSFIGKYPLSKTLRFELRPIGQTLSHIEKKGLLDEDAHRAESYKKVKKLIDSYHKDFIEKALVNLQLSGLLDYADLYNQSNKNEAQQKAFVKLQSELRKAIVKHLKKHQRFSNLDKKELIRHDLLEFVQSDDDKALVLEFGNFTTYFTGFHENRKNMYSDEEKSTAIAYRLINQNLPKFIDNLKVFEQVKSTPELSQHFSAIEQELAAILQGQHLEDFFKLDCFNQTLTQKGIDRYNEILGGYTDPHNANKKYKGLNEYINLYNQKVPKDKRVGKLTRLFKQILSDRESISFLPEAFEDDQAVLDALRSYYETILDDLLNQNNSANKSLTGLLNNIGSFDLARIYLRNDATLTEISQKLYGDWGMLQQGLEACYDGAYQGRNQKDPEKYEAERKKHFKNIESFSIENLNDALPVLENGTKPRLEDYFIQLGTIGGGESLGQAVIDAYANLESLLASEYPDHKNLSQDSANIALIKTFLDSVKALQWFIKPLLGKGTEADKDARFYGDFTAFWTALDQVTPLYNSVRNYMTRKPYSTEKIKLNFENSTLMDGWDVNKERDNTGLLFLKDGLYYLGIMDKGHNRIFSEAHMDLGGEVYRKMEYKLLPGPNKMLPKVFFSKSRIDEFCPSEEVCENYKRETHKKGEAFNLSDCHELIDFFKTSINKHEDWKQFGFQFSDTSSYNDISGFYREVEHQGYKLTYRNISASVIDQLVEEGKLYLFQIYNKDFSPYSKGTPNLHTLYFKAIFDEENLKDVVYKLNGQAEIFYRKASINQENRIIHEKNKMVKNKNPLNPKKESHFDYDLIKDRRYTVDKFQFHVPITLNFKAEGRDYLNYDVNRQLKAAENFHVIGIDRGERHLLYLTVIDPRGKIVEQHSLNQIVNEHQGQHYETNYHDLLTEKEKGRDEARKNWQTIENIKELKEGYLSQVIHKITQLMIKYDAIVVLEDLNLGFMRGRQKVEKQVYQKFEKMLIDKLNYLVNKTAPVNAPGGLLKAYQLTNKFESFQKLGKQSGFLFYIPAWNTSKMDPTTGFVNLFNGKDLRYESVEKARTFFEKFDRIAYNDAEGHFEFHFDYSHFTYKAEGSQTKWILCTHGQRIHTFRNPQKNSQWDSETIDLTAALKTLFEQNDINPQDPDLKAAILNRMDKAFFVELLALLRLTLQMRNSITGTDIDYLISPVKNGSGEFFDSRQNRPGLPENADANGAYNIARKGLWIIEQIKDKEPAELDKLKLAISNKEWLAYAQKHQQ